MSDINIIRGDTANLDLVCYQAGSSQIPADLTNAEVFFTVKEQRKHADDLAVVKKCTPIQNGIAITNPTQGEATVLIPPAETSTLLTGPHWYDVQVKDSIGDVATLITGRFIVEYDITRRIVC
tara:strand:- start:3363 stop:3731 length:369 start_codon:yes stop_codon:yes gene_type:complete